MEHRTNARVIREPLKGCHDINVYAIVKRAYLVADVIDSTRVCTQTDDLAAYLLLRSFLDSMCDAVYENSGVLVKTLGDGVEACFENPLKALSCGLRVSRILDRQERNPFVGVRVAITYGDLIEYTVNGRLDYFGRAVIVASRISQHGARPGVYMSSTFVGLPSIATCLGDFPVAETSACLKGISDPVNIYALFTKKRQRDPEPALPATAWCHSAYSDSSDHAAPATDARDWSSDTRRTPPRRIAP